MPGGISRLTNGLSPHKLISRVGELQLKAEFAVVRYIVKAGSSLLAPQGYAYLLYTILNTMAARFRVDVPVTEEAIANHRRRIEEVVLPLNNSTRELLRLHN